MECHDNMNLDDVKTQAPFALCTGRWLCILEQGGGGFGNGLTFIARTGETTRDITPAGKIRADVPAEQLFRIGSGGSQKQNVIRDHPTLAANLRGRLAELRAGARTVP